MTTVLLCCLLALVTQIFRPERATLGNTNIVRVQPIDSAAWIWLPGAPIWGEASGSDPWVDDPTGANCSVARFRCSFVSDGSPITFDVSADERFVLLLDGEPIARGPHRGLITHWYYQTYKITELPAGSHVLEAVCWQLGASAPIAQLSYRGGFILKAEGAYDAKLTTGRADWRVGRLNNLRMAPSRKPKGVFGAGLPVDVVGTSFIREMPEAWEKPVIARGSIRDNYFGGRMRGWRLFPTERPDQLNLRQLPGRVVNTTFELARPTVVPPKTKLDLWWDLEDYFCAYPELETSGGKGAKVTWGWSEALRDAKGKKGNRGEWKGRDFSEAMTDMFLPDGRPDALFTTPWWRCGRWCRLVIETAEEPLEIRRIGLCETRYPLAFDAMFESDDPELARIDALSRRTLACSTHEMLFDCPYYEQQMYPGDTLVQLGIHNAVSRDCRMQRFALSLYDYDRRDNGMTAMNSPTRGTQESATYTMCWLRMFGDFVMWHDNADFLRARLPGIHAAALGLAYYENADGFLIDLPGWSFTDWIYGRSRPEQEWYRGIAPGGTKAKGVSALENLQYLLALQSVIAVDEALGEKDLAAAFRARADRLARAIVARFWDPSRGMLADNEAKTAFSEHAQALAIRAGILSADQRASALGKMASHGPEVASASCYFIANVLEAFASEGRGDLILEKFAYWRTFLSWDAKTAFEQQWMQSRSDCHGWSACPAYFLQTAIAGVRPAEPYFRTVQIAPLPAGLKRVHAKTPSPQGMIETDFVFEGAHVKGSVTLPGALAGTFVWKGSSHPIHPGKNVIDFK